MATLDLDTASHPLEQQHLKTGGGSDSPEPERMLRLLIAFEGASYEDSQAIAASVAMHAPWRDQLAFLQEIVPHIVQDGCEKEAAPPACAVAYARRARHAAAAAQMLAGLKDEPGAFHAAVRLLRTTCAKPPALVRPAHHDHDDGEETHTLREAIVAALGVSIVHVDRDGDHGEACVSVKPVALQAILDGALNCPALEVKCFVMLNADKVLHHIERFAPRSRLTTRDWLALRNRLSILQEQLHSVGVISGLPRSLSAGVVKV
jgi:hypothetical protein